MKRATWIRLVVVIGAVGLLEAACRGRLIAPTMVIEIGRASCRERV